MFAIRARRPLIALLVTAGLLAGLVPAPVAAVGPQLPLPDTMAAIGDSITQAASTGPGGLGTNAPQNSWSTGTTASVNSHYLRLLAAGAPVGGQNHNFSVSGAKVGDLAGQVTTMLNAGVRPDYLTVLIGGNDVCTPTPQTMTDPGIFRASFEAALTTLWNTSPDTKVYVVSIPRVLGLWELFYDDWWPRIVWSVGGVCQSLLANPTSFADADVARRAAVDQRNRDFNAALAAVCGSYSTSCHWDGGVAYDTAFLPGDVSGDYFHPSAAGQAKLAAVSWGAGYQWQLPNQGPTASFTHACTALACSFSDTSSDPEGVIGSRTWNFGGAGISNLSDPAHPTHTYAAGGTYTVTLTVTDGGGLTSTATASVTVAPAPTPTMRVADLAGSATRVSSSAWRASVVIQVTTPSGQAVQGVTVSGTWTAGAPDTCITAASGSCTVTSDDLSRSATKRVTFRVTGVTHPTGAYVYNAAANVETSITISRP